MDESFIEAEGASLEEAEALLAAQITEDMIIGRRSVQVKGGLSERTATATSIEQAFEKCKVPDRAAIEKKEVTQEPSMRTVEVDAYDEQTARNSAVLGTQERIDLITLSTPGKKGFLGFGKTPNQYRIAVSRPASVKIAYQQKARVRADLVPPPLDFRSAEKAFDGSKPSGKEWLSGDEQTALRQIYWLGCKGNTDARRKIESLIKGAKATLLSSAEFSQYHGYQRQQTAAQIIGILGGTECIAILEEARAMQWRNAGGPHSNNRTAGLVSESIDSAVSELATKKRA